MGCVPSKQHLEDSVRRHPSSTYIDHAKHNLPNHRITSTTNNVETGQTRSFNPTTQSQFMPNQHFSQIFVTIHEDEGQPNIQSILNQLNQPQANREKIKDKIDRIINKFYKNQLEMNQFDVAYLSGLMMNYEIQKNHGYRKVVQSYYYKALNIYKMQEPTYFQETITLQNNFAIYYSTFQQKTLRQQAYNHLSRALRLIKKYGQKDDFRLILAYNNIGCFFGEMKKYKKCLGYFKQGLQLECQSNKDEIQQLKKNMQIYEKLMQQRQRQKNRRKMLNQSMIKSQYSSNYGNSFASVSPNYLLS